MNRFAFSLVAIAGLAACEAPTSPGLTIGAGTLERANTITAETVAPTVSAATLLQTFETYCGANPGNAAGTRRAAQAGGYFLLASGTLDGLQMWASDDGRPLVATGSRDGADVCMVLAKEGRDLSGPIASYMLQKHGGAATNLGSMDIGGDTAENVHVVPGSPPILYFSLVQTQPGLGRVEAFATVTE